MSEIQDKVIALQDRILKEGYYDTLWCRQLENHNMSVATIDQHEHGDRELILLCHHFWESLPDGKEIRRGPFFDLCDIAEHIFDQGGT